MHPAAKSPALIPTTTRPLPLAVAAKGARIFDESGLDYIDASSGPLAVSVGHGHPKVLQALRDQFAAVDYVHRTQFRNEAAGRLAELVTARLGGGLDHVLFVGSGSEANELAMKFAHLYYVTSRSRRGRTVGTGRDGRDGAGRGGTGRDENSQACAAGRRKYRGGVVTRGDVTWGEQSCSFR